MRNIELIYEWLDVLIDWNLRWPGAHFFELDALSKCKVGSTAMQQMSVLGHF